MQARVQALYRHPVKGFTPEQMERVDLQIGRGFPFDRVFAVEDGPSGFDAQAPAFVSKMKFTVLAKIPKVALARTRFDDARGVLTVEADGARLDANLFEEEGRAAFAAWLQRFLGEEASGSLRVLPAPGDHRFFDHPQGFVSVINLASVRDLSDKMGMRLDPLRFRANIYVDDLPAWSELEAKRVRLGAVTADVFKPIVRCAATHVDPITGVRDADVVAALHAHYGHMHCGLYLHVSQAGALAPGDDVELFV